MQTPLCSQAAVELQFRSVRSTASASVRLRNPHPHDIWTTLQSAEHQSNRVVQRSPWHLACVLAPGEETLLEVDGRIMQGSSRRNMRDGNFEITFALAVFFSRPVVGEAPDWVEYLAVRAKAPRNARVSSTMGVNIGMRSEA